MITRTDIGYQPGSGWLYAWHPILKGVALLSVILMFSMHRLSATYTGIGLFLLMMASPCGGVPLDSCLRPLHRIWVLLVVVAAAHLSSYGFQAWPGAVDAVFRVIGVFVASMIFLSITPQAELMYFWEACFRPFGLVGLPAREMALMMVIAVRFLPVIMGELERIRLAQMARGARFGKTAGWLQGARQFLPLLIPTLVLSIERASDLALAMEARGYRLAGERTRLHQYRWTLKDAMWLGLLAIGVGEALLGKQGLIWIIGRIQGMLR